MFDDNSKSGDRFRYSLAIFLSMGILLIWTFYFQPPSPSPSQNKLNQSETNQTALGTQPQSSKTSQLSQLSTLTVTGSEYTNTSFPFAEEIVYLENDTIRVGIHSLGGVIVESEIRFQATERTKEKKSPELEEVSLEGFETGNIFFDKPPRVVPKKIPYRIVSQSESELILEGSLQSVGGPVSRVIKRFLLSEYRVKMNLSFPDLPNLNYYLVNGSGLTEVKDKNSFYNIVNLSYNVGESITTPLSKGILNFFSSPPEIEWASPPFDWVSMDDRFYARILKPITTVEQSFFMQRNVSENVFNISGVSAHYQGGAHDYEFYYLPKSRNLLDSFYDSDEEYFFNLFHQFGFMRIISSIMYWVIESINGFVFNYGWSILIMTFLLKIAVFPLQQKSMNSMQRMQELSPKIKSIRENFKNKPQKMNQELMALYKKEGVNPLGGCLPMLIPLPVFISLYSLFINMVEIQGSSFLWIKDLSLPDKLFQFGFDLPFLGSDFHLLPVIVMVSSILQSLFTPQAPTTPENQVQMKMMKYMMPFFFFFISWSMSSALLLYWTAQNLFTVGQTLLVKKRRKKKS